MQFLEFVDAGTAPGSRGTSRIAIGIHGIKIGKWRMDLPGWMGMVSDLVKSGAKPGEAALAATAESIRQDPAALQAALFGTGKDPEMYFNLLAAMFGFGPLATDNGPSSAADANDRAYQAEQQSRSSTGPVLLIAGAAAIAMITGLFSAGRGRSSRFNSWRVGRQIRNAKRSRTYRRRYRRPAFRRSFARRGRR